MKMSKEQSKYVIIKWSGAKQEKYDNEFLVSHQAVQSHYLTKYDVTDRYASLRNTCQASHPAKYELGFKLWI